MGSTSHYLRKGWRQQNFVKDHTGKRLLLVQRNGIWALPLALGGDETFYFALNIRTLHALALSLKSNLACQSLDQDPNR